MESSSGGKLRRLFLSCVTREFGAYRSLLASDLRLPNVDVKVQEDFVVGGGTLLEKLDHYIRSCDGVIHLVGQAPGWCPTPMEVFAWLTKHADLTQRVPALADLSPDEYGQISYTQWEAWLALYYDRPCYIYCAAETAPRDPSFACDASEVARQQSHLTRLERAGRDRGQFTAPEDLCRQVLRSLQGQGGGETPLRKPTNLPYASLGSLFRGRTALLDSLRAKLLAAPDADSPPTVLCGMSGVGKTRLAVEFAWQHRAEFSALLFVTADSPQALHDHLAALAGPLVLDLRLKEDESREVRVAAAIRWLADHPGWFLIIDNVDTEEAAAEVEKLLASIHGGRVVVTARIANWSPMVERLDVDVLAPDEARDFLLARTESTRLKTPDDVEQAALLARDLDGLSLALEQAGAYVGKRRIRLRDYRESLLAKSKNLLDWHDPRLMAYPRSVANTYQTSVERLNQAAQDLLHVVSWYGPEPIPLELLLVEDARTDERLDGLADLEGYSLVKRSVDGQSIVVHRLVQEFSRVQQAGGPTGSTAAPASLTTALDLLWAAWPREAGGEAAWTRWNALHPHVAHAVGHAERFGNPAPTAALLAHLGLYLSSQALYDDAERLLRRALAIDEAASGLHHPDVARDCALLARLLKESSREADAEAMIRRALEIDESATPPDRSNIARDLNELGEILFASGRLAERETLYRRALELRRAHFGEEHMLVAETSNNLGSALQDLRRYDEAEALYLQALRIGTKTLPPFDRELAIWHNNLASLYSDTGRRDLAEQMYRRAVELFRGGSVPNHPASAVALTNLALLLDQRQPAEARAARLQAAEIRWSYFGVQDEQAMRWASNLLHALARAGDHAGLKQSTHTLLEVMERMSARSGAEASLPLLNYAAKCLEALRRWDDASELYATGLQRMPQNPLLAGNLALVMIEGRRDFAGAAEMLRQSLAAHPQDAVNRTTLAAAELALGQVDSACQLLVTAWKRFQAAPDPYAGRTLWLRTVAAAQRGQSVAHYLGQFRQLWLDVPESATWLSHSLAQALLDGCRPEDRPLLEALVAGVCDARLRPRPTGHSPWESIAPIPLDAPWP